ncbi:hypothetical protein CLOAM1344 [Candidatus Cloacimonas acidaminovorans str. Evry]|uniref:Uncharacterized protein n=1 Tax=Cloacimonas acidaminovorans (strain Evry) TaxID=459349 RepID=B0VJ08_CLOAI|nr:hypothetical protein CLOAM1344 [Candidatus Cloacimonas acidaminovorans str. Evry]
MNAVILLDIFWLPFLNPLLNLNNVVTVNGLANSFFAIEFAEL